MNTSTPSSQPEPIRAAGSAATQPASDDVQRQRAQSNDSDHQDDLVDDESEQSFPASDPPGWTLGSH